VIWRSGLETGCHKPYCQPSAVVASDQECASGKVRYRKKGSASGKILGENNVGAQKARRKNKLSGFC
jgi:hypothetical protein